MVINMNELYHANESEKNLEFKLINDHQMY